MEAFSALLAICAENSPVPGEFTAQRPVTRSFDVFFDMRLNKRLSKQSWGWWFETLSCPLWRHCHGLRKMLRGHFQQTLWAAMLAVPWVTGLTVMASWIFMRYATRCPIKFTTSIIRQRHHNRPTSQIPQRTKTISHNEHECTFQLQSGALWEIWIIQCGICEMGQ